MEKFQKLRYLNYSSEYAMESTLKIDIVLSQELRKKRQKRIWTYLHNRNYSTEQKLEYRHRVTDIYGQIVSGYIPFTT